MTETVSDSRPDLEAPQEEVRQSLAEVDLIN
jgi:hypothetical protein